MSGMALVVDRRGATLEEGNHQTVVLRHADGTRERIGMRALSAVVMNGDVMVSTHMLRTLAENGVALVMMPVRGQSQCIGFTCLPHRMAGLRHAQHMTYANMPQRLALAKQIVLLKISAQAKLVDHLGGCTPLDNIQQAVQCAGSICELMGVEGGFAQSYFARLAEMLPDTWRFSGRNRRPPRDPFNALMSLSYTLAQSALGQLALRHGLDLEVGFLHGIQNSRQSLALDLLECARADMDGWLLGLAIPPDGLQPRIHPEDFSDNLADGCRLSKQARELFYRLWFSQGQQLALHAARPGLACVLRALRYSRDNSLNEPYAMDEDVL